MQNKIILLAILGGAISAIYYIANNTGFKSFRGEKTTTIERQKDNLSQEEKILDCAKKIAQDEELLAKGENKQGRT